MVYNKIDYKDGNLLFYTENGVRYMYSKKSPALKAKKEVEYNFDKKYKLIFIIGNGLGYHFEEILKIHGDKNVVYFIIEPIQEVYEFYKKNMYDKKLKDFNNVYYTNGDYKEIIGTFRAMSRNFDYYVNIREMNFFVMNFYDKYFKDKVSDLKGILNDLISNSLSLSGNSIDDWILGLYNILRNSEYFEDSINLNDYKNIYKNKPAIIVSAGPSLDKNFHLLKDYKNKAVIFGQDATYEKLLNNGIKPDFVSSFERDYITYDKFFKDKKIDVNNITFLNKTVVWPETNEWVKRNNGKLSFVFTDTLSYEKKLGELCNLPALNIDSSVAILDLAVALQMGCNPIIFIGQDLSYSEDGYTHAGDISINDKKNLKDESLLTIKGINGGYVRTTKILNMFKEQIENIIIKNPNTTFVNSTEGGALIRGTKNMKFKESLESYLKKNISKKILKSNTKNKKKIIINDYKKNIEDIRLFINNIRENADEEIINEILKNEIQNNLFFQNVFFVIIREFYVKFKPEKDINKKKELLDDFIDTVEKILDIIENYFNIYFENDYKNIKESYENAENIYIKIEIAKKYKLPYKAIEDIDKYLNSDLDKNERYKMILEKLGFYSFYKIKKTDSGKYLEVFESIRKLKNDKEFNKFLNNIENEKYKTLYINILNRWAKNSLALIELELNGDKNHNNLSNNIFTLVYYGANEQFKQIFPVLNFNKLNEVNFNKYFILLSHYEKLNKTPYKYLERDLEILFNKMNLSDVLPFRLEDNKIIFNEKIDNLFKESNNGLKIEENYIEYNQGKLPYSGDIIREIYNTIKKVRV